MKALVVDKIASVTQACELERELRIDGKIPCEEGVVVAVEILNNKANYNQLELTSGRMAQVKRGDIVVGALGHRHALFGYSGHLPQTLEPGDTVQMLNMGGVLGLCDSINPERGSPFDCRVLGTVLVFPFLGERIGVPARIGQEQLNLNSEVDTRGVPVVALAGTCMDSGKTAAACAVVSRLRHEGLTIDAFKATGVSLRRDILAMEDAGARNTGIFTDLGIVTTTPASGPALTKTLLTRLAAEAPDMIVFELGDGLLGAYGVEAILRDPAIQDAITTLVLCANDPVAAWGGVKILRDDFGIDADLVTGPATDNDVGVKLIEERLGVKAINALTRSVQLGDAVLADIRRKVPRDKGVEA